MPDSIDRRRVLQLGGAVLGGTLAGCTSLRGSGQSVRIENPKIRNWTERALDVDVHLLENGESRYWERISVDAGGPEESDIGGAPLEGFPQEAGEYVLHAQLPFVELDGPSRKSFAQLGADNDTSCLIATITIDTWQTDGTEHPSVTIAHAINC